MRYQAALHSDPSTITVHFNYLKDNVSQEAFTQNRQQDPMLAGDPDKILIKF